MNNKIIGSHEVYKLNHRVNEKGILERRCTSCQEWKEENYDNFYYVNKKASKLRFTPECRECAKERSKKNGNDNKERRSAYFKEWHQKNKERMNAKCRQWMIDNREYAKNYIEAWRRSEEGKAWCNSYSNDRRVHKEHDITKKEWESCKIYFDEECAYCGMPLKIHKKIVKQDLHKEHVDHNGLNDLSNCVPACRLCNSTKHDKGFDEWYNELNPNYTQVRYDKIIKWRKEDYIKYLDPKKNNISLLLSSKIPCIIK